MRYYLNWRYGARRLTIKDVIIVISVVIIGFQWAFIFQNEIIVNKLNAENERLEIQNERLSHLLNLSIEALQRTESTHVKEDANANIRDPFRHDHPTREEKRVE